MMRTCHRLKRQSSPTSISSQYRCEVFLQSAILQMAWVIKEAPDHARPLLCQSSTPHQVWLTRMCNQDTRVGEKQNFMFAAMKQRRASSEIASATVKAM